jgi:glycosyltransferase involved in cell wall biosynthesis
MGAERPLRIAVASRAVAPQHGFGGLERAVAHHLRALTRRGITVAVLTQPPDPAHPAPTTYGGMVSWHTVPYRRRALPLRPNSIPDRLIHYPPFSRALGAAIVEHCRRTPIDIVHAHGLAGLGYAEQHESAVGSRQSAEGSLRHRINSWAQRRDEPLPTNLPPLVLNPHGLEEFSQRQRAKWLAYTPFRLGVRRTARAATRVIATDQALVLPIARHLTVPINRIALLSNGVAPDELDALIDPALARDLAGRYRLEDAPLTLISVARLERNKGLREGIAALSLLRDQLPAGWRWLIIGRGNEEAALREAIDSAGYADNITLVGALPDAEVHNLLARADLALVPSLYEGSSLVALEALTHRLPVVATTAGGLPDKIIPGETGFLAAPSDPAAFASALTAAIAARERWPAIGATGRALVERQFSWDALAADYEALYRALIAERSRAAAQPAR